MVRPVPERETRPSDVAMPLVGAGAIRVYNNAHIAINMIGVAQEGQQQLIKPFPLFGSQEGKVGSNLLRV